MKLFESYTLGGIPLQNRMVLAPLTRSRATAEHVPTDIMATYYGQRAGAGLLITEGTSPSPSGAGYPRIPGLYNDAQVAAWKKVTAAAHERGAKIFVQLMHTGRASHPLNMPEGTTVLAPSALALSDQTLIHTDEEGMQPAATPKAMTLDEIQQIKADFVQAARLAIEAGFDGVELHGANGYLIEQFISPVSNQRTDEYGGSVEHRGRFLLEVAEETMAAIGKDKVGVRLSPYGVFNEVGGYDSIDETFTYLAKALNEAGVVYIHLVDHEAMGAPQVPTHIKDMFRETFKGTLILSGGYDKARAEADLQADKGELVAFGRPFIANPDLPERFKQDAPLNAPDFNTFYTPGEAGYIDYPTLEETTA